MSDNPRLINGRWVKPPAGGWAKRAKVPASAAPWRGSAPTVQGACDRALFNGLRRLESRLARSKGKRRKPFT